MIHSLLCIDVMARSQPDTVSSDHHHEVAKFAVPTRFDVIINKPEFSFLMSSYNLLYQSLIPNYRLAISSLRQHISISDSVEEYIANAGSRRKSCQRLFDFLLICLYSDKDYMQFCCHFNAISVMTALPHKLIAEFQKSSHWRHNTPAQCKQILPKPLSSDKKCKNRQSDQAHLDKAEYAVTGIMNAEASEHKAIRRPARIYHRRNRQILKSTKIDEHENCCSPPKTSLASTKDHYSHNQEVPLSSLLIQLHKVEYKQQSTSTILSPSLNIIHDDSTNHSPSDVTTSVVQSSMTHLAAGADLSPEELQIPSKLNDNKDFAQLRQFYHAMVQLMPNEYECSVGKLQQILSDESICLILSSGSSAIANKTILDCLIDKIRNKEEILDFCDQLESISKSYELIILTYKIRSGVERSIQFSSSTTDASNPGFWSVTSFPQISNCKVLTVLEDNYQNLCQCLSSDYVLTLTRLKGVFRNERTYDNTLSYLRTLPTVEMINQTIVDSLLERVTGDSGVLVVCDVINDLVDSAASRKFLQFLRHAFVKALRSPFMSNRSSSNQIDSSTYKRNVPGYTRIVSTHPTSTVQPPLTNTANAAASIVPSRNQLREQIRYSQARTQKEFKYQQPPPLPLNYVCRAKLLDEIANKLCSTLIDANSYSTSVTITGTGGFGKTTIATALCHHPIVKEKFTDGFVFVELGPQATDPSVKLSQLYHLLTGQSFKQGDVNYAEQEIQRLTNDYFCNLLVVIDDVWFVEDAEPIVKAFCNCNIVITSRMNDNELYISTKHTVIVGPMEMSEAITLLTCGVIDTSQLSQSEMDLLDELAQDVHLWPLLLALVKGQLSHSIKQCHMPCYEAIQNLKARLYDRGLTAFDKNNIGNVFRSRKYAVKVCIEATLALLTESLLRSVTILVLYTGIGTSLPTPVLGSLWSVSKQEAMKSADALWAYGLVQFTDVAISPYNCSQCCIEVHSVVGQFIVENLEWINLRDVFAISHVSMDDALNKSFEKSYGIKDLYAVYYKSLPEYVRFLASDIEHSGLPYHLRLINKSSICDPIYIIIGLIKVEEALLILHKENKKIALSSVLEQTKSLMSECQKILKDSQKATRIFRQTAQRNLHERDYDTFVMNIENYCANSPLTPTVQKCIDLFNEIIMSCSDSSELLCFIAEKSETFHSLLPQFHNNLKLLSFVKLSIRLLKQMHTALLTGSPNIEIVANYVTSGKFHDERNLLEEKYNTLKSQVKLCHQ
ncbi:uncharacterized protein [Dysidea avara]|uniref:uncharacterized protein isoform X2 n=1 Tax=Dysidea avara TaxID=196820 RepID=UPI003331E91D